MAKDYNGKTILWVVMYQEPYDCDWHLAGIYEDIEGATAHVACIASPYSGEEYKIEARNISSTEELAFNLYHLSGKSRVGEYPGFIQEN